MEIITKVGFVRILQVFVIACLLAIVSYLGIRFLFANRQQPLVTSSEPTKMTTSLINPIRLSPISNENPTCTKTETVFFHQPVIDPSALSSIHPLGQTINGHVTPTDHQYYIPTQEAKQTGVTLRAPADGVVFAINTIDAGLEDPRATEQNRIRYGIAMAFSCNEAMTLGYMSSVAPALQPYISPDNTVAKHIEIPVKVGDEIGRFQYGMDVWLIDTSARLPGFIDAADYRDEPWKFYAQSLADYFEPSLRSAYDAKSLRTVPPLGGKIDYDQPGRLVGNWFKQGSLPDYFHQPDYWQSELAIFYDNIDPATVRVMIGQYADERPANEGFGVEGNGPDPRTISVASGLVRYQLFTYGYADETGQVNQNSDFLTAGHSWKAVKRDDWGVALFQLTDERTLKAEFFPGQAPEQVKDFDKQAIFYTR